MTMHHDQLSVSADLIGKDLPQPSYHNPDNLVENVYPDGEGSNYRNRTSQRRMERHLKDRFTPKPVGHEAFTVEMPDGFRERTRLALGRWLITPKEALAVSLLALVTINSVANAEPLAHNIAALTADAGDEVEQTWFKLQHGEGTPDTTVMHPAETEERIITKTYTVTSHNRVGESDSAAVREQLQEILGKVSAFGGEVTGVALHGGASDDNRIDSRLQKPDAFNKQLGQKRLQQLKQDVDTAARKLGVELPAPVETTKERTLTKAEYAELTALATKAGYADAQAAIAAHDAGAKLPAKLRNSIDELISKQRGASLEITAQRTDRVEVTPGYTEVIPGIHPPENPVRDYEDMMFLPFLLPPVRLLRRVKSLVPQTKTVNFEAAVGDPVWVRLYEEALTANEELKREAAFYTRKLAHLLRDDRVKVVDRMDYDGMDGAERSLRVCYVDHEPTDEARGVLRDVLEAAANGNEGMLADAVSTIMVYPSENAGLAHGDPKRIGLGIDKQDPKGVQGVTMPLLGLIELHMPTDVTDMGELTAFEGPGYVLAHELGHALDVNTQKPTELIPTAIAGEYVSGSQWRNAGHDVHSTLRPLPVGPDEPPIEYAIERILLDKDGNPVPRRAVVPQGDSRITEAVAVRIVGAQPTRYSSASPAEGFAESYAGELMNTLFETEIPFKETGRSEPTVFDGNFAKGYSPARPSVDMVEGATAINFAQPDSYGSVVFTATTVAEDPALHSIASRVRQTPTPREEDMVAVLGTVVG